MDWSESNGEGCDYGVDERGGPGRSESVRCTPLGVVRVWREGRPVTNTGRADVMSTPHEGSVSVYPNLSERTECERRTWDGAIQYCWTGSPVVVL